MLSTLLRPLYIFLVILSFGLGCFFGSFPPDLEAATNFGKFSAFIGTFIIMAALPTITIYFRFRARLKMGVTQLNGYFWRTVQFSMSGSIMTAIIYFIGVSVLPLGWFLVFSSIAIFCYLCMAHALNLFEIKLNNDA